MEDSFFGHIPLAGPGRATYHYLSRRTKSNLIAKPQISKLRKSSENLKGLLQALKYSLFNLPALCRYSGLWPGTIDILSR